jgi:hypothetical protein
MNGVGELDHAALAIFGAVDADDPGNHRLGAAYLPGTSRRLSEPQSS